MRTGDKDWVLVVDDEPAVRRLLVRQLERFGLNCESASDGSAALDLLKSGSTPSLVLADVQMPGISGQELLSEIKAFDRRIQVIMISGRSDLDTVRQCMRDGAYDFVLKPFQNEELKNTIHRALETRRLTRQNDEYRRNLERMVAEKTHELTTSHERFRDFAESAADSFWELDADLRLAYVSRDFREAVGLELDDVLGRTHREIFEGAATVSADWTLYEATIAQRGRLDGFQVTLQVSNDELRIFRLSGKPVLDEESRFVGYRGVTRNITEEYELTQRIAYQAQYDVLTGLLNRREFDLRLSGVVDRARRHGIDSALCYLDLDQFKLVNDTVGHSAGDELLAQISEVLLAQVPEGATLARLGGDEFGLIVEGVSLVEAERVCERIIRAANEFRFHWEGRWFEVGASIGIVPITEASDTEAVLLSRADMACYAAKDLGRNQISILRDEDDEAERKQSDLFRVVDISRAVEEERLFLVKQPIVAPSRFQRRATHYELLVRLYEEGGSVVMPGRIIPVAEKYGAIIALDRWVVSTALRRYSEWFGDSGAVISVNLSGKTLNDRGLTEFVTEAIVTSGFDPRLLCFEITETAAIANLHRANMFIGQMHELGVQFALDDFGSGLSSFNYLRTLAVDYLKIDGSLVRHVAEDEQSLAIVRSINEIGHVMGMKTIAEFVEDEKTIQCLESIGVDFVQGYGISRPVPVAETYTVGATGELAMAE